MKQPWTPPAVTTTEPASVDTFEIPAQLETAIAEFREVVVQHDSRKQPYLLTSPTSPRLSLSRSQARALAAFLDAWADGKAIKRSGLPWQDSPLRDFRPLSATPQKDTTACVGDSCPIPPKKR